MAVHVPTNVTGRTDSFIDDLIRVFLDTPANREREPHAVPLAIHVTSRPHLGPNEPVTRRGLLSDPKLIAEGTPAEVQLVLGWSLNTRSLSILLPPDKFEAWSSDLHTIIRNGTASFDELDSTVGQLNHAGYAIPLSRHFPNCLRLRILVRRPNANKSRSPTMNWKTSCCGPNSSTKHDKEFPSTASQFEPHPNSVGPTRVLSASADFCYRDGPGESKYRHLAQSMGSTLPTTYSSSSPCSSPSG